MMINTYKLLKGLNIFLVYNIIMVLTLLTVLFHNMHKTAAVKSLNSDCCGDNNDTQIPNRNITNNEEIQPAPTEKCIQLGIYYTLYRIDSKVKEMLTKNDYTQVETHLFNEFVERDKIPTYSYPKFNFTVYGLFAFNHLRSLFKIQNDDYVKSLCGYELINLSKLGGSSSIFYITKDNKFIIKTAEENERRVLINNMLEHYINHFSSNKDSLLTKFTGLYVYKPRSYQIILVIMNNLFPSDVKIHEKYDLKGSTDRRYVSDTKKISTHKDDYFKFKYPKGIFLLPMTRNDLLNIIKIDCDFLKQHNIMDYSLLIGIHNIDKVEEPDTPLNKAAKDRWVRLMDKSIRMNISSIQAATENVSKENVDSLIDSIPAISGTSERLLLFVGIIDILQTYRLRKKGEHLAKITMLRGNISVQNPEVYASRFYNFLSTSVFMPVSSGEIEKLYK